MRTDSQIQRLAEATGVLTNGFDPSLIEALPGQRTKALKKVQPTDADGSPELYDKRAAYYSALTNMIQELRVQYYFHQDFPSNLCAPLEEHAVVLAGIQYPLSGTTGCSYYGFLIIDKRIELAEAMICQMVHAIYEAAWEVTVASDSSKQSLASYRAWLQKWDGKKNVRLRKQLSHYDKTLNLVL